MATAIATCVIVKKNDSTIEARLTAARLLSGTAFKLYSFLDTFTIDEIIFYERMKVSKTLGISREGLNSAFSELLKNYYLRQVNENSYNFFGVLEEKSE